jgi:hypothetical protein
MAIIGVTGYDLPTKRDALLFEKVYSLSWPPKWPFIKRIPRDAELRFRPRHIQADYEFLVKYGIISEYGLQFKHTRTSRSTSVYNVSGDVDALISLGHSSHEKNLLPDKPRGDLFSVPDLIEKNFSSKQFEFYYKYFSASAIRSATPVLVSSGFSAAGILGSVVANGTGEDPKTGRVIDIVLKNLPVPSELTPWEAIIDFRQDANIKLSFLELRRWMREVAKGEKSTEEITEELEYLMARFEHSMRVHKIKYHSGVLRTILVLPLQIAENMARINFSKLATEGAFSIFDRKIALTEAELSAPGKEVSYIVKARNWFS